ncbi:MAG: ATP-binding cassette domain-containing protein [Flavobacteriales bacterium]|nr:ATP-binding cassette domain-containing protein [Flavobacteriales bacterium]
MASNRVTSIKVESLCKQYSLNQQGNKSAIYALEDVSFNLFEGDRVGLIGLNGSGKSTLLKILSGHLRPSSGRVTLSSEVLSLSHFDSLLHPDLTGTENIRMQLRVLGIPKTALEKACREVVDFSELGESVNRPVKTFSSGMMLRLSFSIFRTVKPEILLLDEVLSAGDILFRKKSDDLLRHHLEAVSCIIMASHELTEIARYCTRCLVLQHGRLVFDGTVDDAIAKYIDQSQSQNNLVLANAEIELVKVFLNRSEPRFEVSEDVTVNVVYLKKTPEVADLVVYIRNNFGNALTDCDIYRESFIRVNEPVGRYLVSFTIPKNLLNVGKYMVDLAFGNGVKDILKIDAAVNFEIGPDKWETEKLWNQNPTVPIRPQLNWKKDRIA